MAAASAGLLTVAATIRAAEQEVAMGYLLRLMLLMFLVASLGWADGERRSSGVPIAIWPQLQGGDRLEPEGIEVRLEPLPEREPEFMAAAGRPFIPPSGRWRVFLTGPQVTSPAVKIMNLGASAEPRSSETKNILLPVVPAGIVRLDPTVEMSADLRWRVMSLDAHNRSEFPDNELIRNLKKGDAQKGVPIALGRAIAWIADAQAKDRLAALFRPFDVASGEIRSLGSQSPQPDKAHVMVLFDWPEIFESHSQYQGQSVALISAGKTYQPETMTLSAQRMIAFWFDLPAGTFQVQVESDRYFLPPETLTLTQGHVHRIDRELQKKPSLRVEFDRPESLGGSQRLTILAGSREILALDLDAEQSFSEIANLPPLEVMVHWDVGPWRFSELADLRSGDGTVRFSPRPIRLFGEIRRGEAALPQAELSLTTDLGRQRTVATTADDEGRYEVLIWRPMMAIARFAPVASPAPPAMEVLEIAEEVEQEHNFVLPAAEREILVVARATGKPLAGAEVNYGHRPLQGQSSSSRMVTDSSGMAALPPLLPGELFLSVSAKGFETKDLTEIVREPDSRRSVRIELDPEGTMRSITFLLPSGAGAAGLELRAFCPATNEIPWRDQADGKGQVELPLRFADRGCFLLGSHAQAGALIAEWPGTEAAAEWQLTRPVPIEARVDPGSLPVGRIEAGLLAPPLRLSGPLLAWLSGTSTAVFDSDGAWFSHRLEERWALLAFASQDHSRFQSGELDAFARALSEQSPGGVLRLELPQ
jgi:hypothetical protein